MKKRILAMVLALCMVLSILPAVSAAEAASGTCGKNLTWTLAEGVLTISGSGEMYNYDNRLSEDELVNGFPGWDDHDESIRSIQILPGVTSIGEYAFQWLENVESITIPSTVRTIGSYALYGLNITTLKIPEGVVSIGDHAFLYCVELTEVHLPSTLRSVGDDAFEWDDSIERVYIPNMESWFRIQFASFFSTPFSDYASTLLYVNNKPVTDIVVPDSVTEIGDAQFAKYRAMTSLRIHDGVTRIGEDAFQTRGADKMTQVIVPASVESIGSYAFADCNRLSDLYILNPDCELGEDILYDSNCYFDEALDEMVYGMTTIHGHSGSTAEVYAEEFYHPFVELPPFTDVEIGSFYYNAVRWAVENQVTSGTSATTFSPNAACNRAAVVTFLWRAAGEPDPKSTSHPFVDVEKGSFYEKAVLWAVENNITNGVDATHFGPTASCNRAQVVTFLYRAKNNPAFSNTACPFTDVAAGQWYEDPILWAVEKGVTNGMGDGTFGVNGICNRAQVVTFLYRTYVN